MQRPPNKQTSVTSVDSETEVYPGLLGFDVDVQQAALEGLNVLSAATKPPSSNVFVVEGDQRKTTSIYKKNDVYYVYFRVSELDSNWGDNLISFSLWLLSLNEMDVVYIHQTGDVYNLTGLITVLDTLGTACKAKKIFVVDHPIDNALFMLVCDDIIITEFGAMTFSNAMCVDPTKWDKILTPYLMSVYAKAVERKYITQAEVDAVFRDNSVIYKTAKDLRSQGVTIS